jgi:hypothetical protein
MSPNVSVEWAALLLCTWKVPGSNLKPRNIYSQCCIPSKGPKHILLAVVFTSFPFSTGRVLVRHIPRNWGQKEIYEQRTTLTPFKFFIFFPLSELNIFPLIQRFRGKRLHMRCRNTRSEIVGWKIDTHLQNTGTYMNKYKEKWGKFCRKAREWKINEWTWLVISMGPVEGSYEHGNETSGSIKCWEVLE